MAASAQSAPTEYALPMAASLGVESLRLGEGERLGLVGASLAFEVAEGWWAGPSVYGAATGTHSGLFVGGARVARTWSLSQDVSLQADLFVGGGGGGAAAVGGGLMLRPSLALMRRFEELQLGVSLSSVRFPSGSISSTQLGLLVAWDGSYRYFDSDATGRSVGDAAVRGGLGLAEFSATIGQYRFGTAAPSVGLVGARAEWRDPSGGGLHGGIEAAAAAHGNAAGYMELLGTLGWEHSLAPSLANLKGGVRGAVGLAGGGGVPGGGGATAKALLTFAWEFAPDWRMGLEAGRIEGLHHLPSARIVQASLSRELDGSAGSSHVATEAQVKGTEWVAGWQRLLHVQRRAGGRGGIDTLGGSFNQSLSDPFYLTVQAQSAYAGGAGAYSTGLVGLGAATAPGAWRVGAEALVGAAGGGGAETGGGALNELNIWVQRKLTREGSVRLGAGEVRSLRGGQSTPALQLSWSEAFGLAER